MKLTNILLGTTVILSTVVILTTCGKDSPTKPEPIPPVTPVATRIDITPSSATFNSIGQTVQLSARVFDQNNNIMNSATVAWSSSDEAVATVSAQGLVTAVRNGTARITATSGSATRSIDVTVMQSAGSIVIAPQTATLMSIGATVQLTATVLDQNGQAVADAAVAWSSSDEAVATVSAQGLVTAVRNGTARITATSGSATRSIDVTVMQSAGSIVIAPQTAMLMSIGATVQLTATVLDQNGQAVADAAVAWSSSDEAVATVSAQGLVTAVRNGTARITATSGSATRSIDVTVMQSAGSIVIAPQTATLMSIGATVQLTATVLDQNGQAVADAAVAWSSSDEAVATVSAQGLVTAVRNGTARITATSGSATRSIDVTVMQSAGSIVIAPQTATLMSIGATVQLTATVLDQNGQAVADAAVAWSSSDEAVATVSAQGLVTAVRNGTARITATSGSATRSIDVTVMQSAGSIVIAPQTATLMSIGATVQLTATVLDQNGQAVADAAVAWSSSDEAVATVSAQGLVTAVRNGTARITATSGSATRSIDVTVMQSAGSIVIAPQTATLMSIGATVQLTATVLDQNGQAVADAAVAWSSSDEAVATVSAQGLVTAVRNGTARITATSGSATRSIDVTVMQSAGSIVIAPQTATLMSIGATVQLTATVLDQNGQAVADAAVAWSSSDEAVATVSAQGLVTAVRNGTARITATSGSATRSIDVTVMQSAGSIVIAPQTATLMSIGATVQLTATVLDQNGQAVADAAVAWSSSDEAVATVSAQGLVTAVRNGTARITATSGSATRSIDVTVMQSAGSIVIAPQTATLMSIGATVQLTATVLDQNGQAVADAAVAWSSSDEAVATVSAQGLVTAVRNGTARITATSGSATRSIDVTVMQSAGSIVIAPQTATLMSIGATVQLTATVLDQNGQAVADAAVAWSSSDEAVATVSAQGLVTAVRNGVARIWASLGNATKSIAVTVQIRLPSPDREVLVVLYNSLGGPEWKNRTNWLSDIHVEEWFGVRTDEEGRVTAINLGNNNLKGQVPALLAQLHKLQGLSLEDNQLTGTIPPELGQLTNLALLYLFNNQLSGNIPSELSQLANLIHLCLNGNRLTGSIPPELGRLVSLQWLHLHENTNLTGALPPTLTNLDLDALLLQGTNLCVPNDPGLKNWLSGISDARVAPCEGLNLERNALEALYRVANGPSWRNNTNWMNEAPLRDWYGVDTDRNGRVTRLDLRNNGLAGKLPSEMGHLDHLTELNLTRNQISGQIPPELGQLERLKTLSLSSNHLTGSIPPELGQLVNLENFDLENNQGSGVIPKELGNLLFIKTLRLQRNRLSGSIPAELGKLGNLTGLHLQENHLTGSIPAELGVLNKLISLSLNSNQITGSIPGELGKLTNLEHLYLSENQLTGIIPAELGDMTNLKTLNLNRNQLTGSIPGELGNLTNLDLLSLSENQLTGIIPAELGGMTNLRNLWIGRNSLTGSIPSELGQLTNLTGLSLYSNRLTGIIPGELGQLTNLVFVDLSDNQLSADIPSELGLLTGLQVLSLQGNRLTGIPPEIGKMSNLEVLNVSDNNLEGSIPPELGNLENLNVLILENNEITGKIPLELSNLSNLEFLHIERNGLTGSIPSELGQLSRLVALHLSHNLLSGSVPDEFGKLTVLRRLRLDHNPLLTGRLPINLTRVNTLQELYLDGTQLCSPVLAEFQMWLDAIAEKRVEYCGARPAELQVLEEFYNATNGENWTNNTNWLSNEPLDMWFGVTTNSAGRVEELDLENNKLAGTLPEELNQLIGLRRLILSGNSNLTGGLPHELVDLHLEALILDGTGLCAPVDDGSQTWLNNVPRKSGVVNCDNETDEELNDREVLVRFYKATEGTNWKNNTNWLSDEPMDTWFGISTNPDGRVTHLVMNQNNVVGPLIRELGQLSQLVVLQLTFNDITGPIPPKLGQLTYLESLSFDSNNLTGPIPPDLGQLKSITDIDLRGNHLTGEIPAELGNLSKLYGLDLSSNSLIGSLPPELGQLTELRGLGASGNQLTGSVPSELWELTNLRRIRLNSNKLTGRIPSDVGKLTNLRVLSFWDNDISGVLPPELGQLTNLKTLHLWDNRLNGQIPAELGQLANLESLALSSNALGGPIPSELRQLVNLKELDLSANQLKGPIPPELGQLVGLTILNLSTNTLEGELPTELGELVNLKDLRLNNNRDLIGSIPLSFTKLNLNRLFLQNTQLCTPMSLTLETWLQEIDETQNTDSRCRIRMNPEAFLTQAVQSLIRPVSLIEGEPALLRVFFETEEVVSNRPPVRATFYLGGDKVYDVDIPAGPAKIPSQVFEGSLDISANAVIPASSIHPGLEMVVEVSPEGKLDNNLGIAARLPETGRIAIEVRPVPAMHLYLIPLLWTDNPDYTIVTQTEGLTANSDLFRLTRDIMPVGDFDFTLHEPVFTSTETTYGNNFQLVREVEAIRVAEGRRGHFVGTYSHSDNVLGGVGTINGFSSIVSELIGGFIAHELGHNMGLGHAPCGPVQSSKYPFEDGSIGAWGYDFARESLIDPSSPDVMGYCFGSEWIGPFHFNRAIVYRSEQEESRQSGSFSSKNKSLLLWGGTDDDLLQLEPSLVVDASPYLPEERGPYRLTGEDSDGNVLFTMDFNMDKLAVGNGSIFAFAIPVNPDWSEWLAQIKLSGPEGYVEITGESGRSATIVLDKSTGTVRGLFRGLSDQETALQSARRVFPEPGLDVFVSPGIPRVSDWER